MAAERCYYMDFKDPSNILEFMQFQKRTYRKYYSYIKNLLTSNYKKAAIFVYWLNDYISYLKEEASFNPSFNISYKRGQIVFVNFGYRIGSELGGNHYAIVLDVKNARSSRTITVIPLKSKRETSSTYANIYHVPLGTCVKDLLQNKAFEIKANNFSEMIKLVGVITGKESIVNVDAETRKRIRLIKRNDRIATDVIEYTKKLTHESVADAGQIVTISKQRINHPCKNTDVLTGIIVPDEYMKQIEERLKFLLLFTANK